MKKSINTSIKKFYLDEFDLNKVHYSQHYIETMGFFYRNKYQNIKNNKLICELLEVSETDCFSIKTFHIKPTNKKCSWAGLCMVITDKFNQKIYIKDSPLY